MAAVVSGQKTSTVDVNPTHPASTLNTIWAIAPELLTQANLQFLMDCTEERAGGKMPSSVLGNLF